MAEILSGLFILAANTPPPDTPTEVRTTFWEVVQSTVAFAIALATLYGLVIRPAAKAIIRHFREAVAEIAAAQNAQTDVLQRVEHQVHPNGGKSAHDFARKAFEATEAIGRDVGAIRAEQRHHSTRLDNMAGEMTAAGWRQQELSDKFTRHDTAGREAMVLFRASLADQGITLPLAPTETEGTDLASASAREGHQ